MKLKALMLCSVVSLTGGFHALEGKLKNKSEVSSISSQYEDAVFNFETGNRDDDDFFSLQETEFLEGKSSQSRIARMKQWFIDQYNYFLLRCFIFYIDLKDKKLEYTSFLKSYYQLWYNKARRYWSSICEKCWVR